MDTVYLKTCSDMSLHVCMVDSKATYLEPNNFHLTWSVSWGTRADSDFFFVFMDQINHWARIRVKKRKISEQKIDFIYLFCSSQCTYANVQQHSIYCQNKVNRISLWQFKKSSLSHTPHGGKAKQLSIVKFKQNKN